MPRHPAKSRSDFVSPDEWNYSASSYLLKGWNCRMLGPLASCLHSLKEPSGLYPLWETGALFPAVSKAFCAPWAWGKWLAKSEGLQQAALLAWESFSAEQQESPEVVLLAEDWRMDEMAVSYAHQTEDSMPCSL